MNSKERFNLALKVLIPRLSELLGALSDEEKNEITEIRVRAEKPAVIMKRTEVNFISQATGKLTCFYSPLTVSLGFKELQEIFHRVCGYSVYAFKDSVNRGYITVEGGHRVGVIGTAATDNSEVTAVRDISCINIRIAREIKGAADDIFNRFYRNGLSSVIIAGPPSSGKTTVLRDLARQISGAERGLMKKVFICDERGEIGAASGGIPQNDLGVNCDLATAYPKIDGIMTGLRSFSPDIIICDEIATEDEVRAIESGLNSGVDFALSIHAKDEKDLKTKRILKSLLLFGEFDSVILLSGKNIGKTEKIFKAGELIA